MTTLNALYINLDDRPDRRAEAEREFAKHGINATRVSAIKGNPTTLPTPRGLPGEVGCALSHMKCVQLAKDSGWDKVVIYEDDVEFRENYTNLFSFYLSEVPDDWDMIYIGGNHWGRDLSLKHCPKLTKVTENVYKTTHTLTTHAYILRDTVYDEVIKHLSTAYMPVDVMYSDLQERFNVYAFRPNLAWQRPSKSDINNKMCDYVYFLKNW
jgi:glycosyl transferase, family 25